MSTQSDIFSHLTLNFLLCTFQRKILRLCFVSLKRCEVLELIGSRVETGWEEKAMFCDARVLCKDILDSCQEPEAGILD